MKVRTRGSLRFPPFQPALSRSHAVDARSHASLVAVGRRHRAVLLPGPDVAAPRSAFGSWRSVTYVRRGTQKNQDLQGQVAKEFRPKRITRLPPSGVSRPIFQCLASNSRLFGVSQNHRTWKLSRDSPRFSIHPIRSHCGPDEVGTVTARTVTE